MGPDARTYKFENRNWIRVIRFAFHMFDMYCTPLVSNFTLDDISLESLGVDVEYYQTHTPAEPWNSLVLEEAFKPGLLHAFVVKIKLDTVLPRHAWCFGGYRGDKQTVNIMLISFMTVLLNTVVLISD